MPFQGARTMQWLVPKPPNWSPEPDDQEFETSSQYFLTGLVEVIDNNFAEMTPIRHGVRSARGKNGYLHSIFEDKGEIPFHPSCFELFKRLSRQVRGFVDVDALVDWRNHEYLVANPVEVPGLQALLETCPKICANSVSVSTLIAQYVRRPTIMRGTDPFTKLPKEIQHKVLEDMDPGDVANLRLVSREFLQLPNMFFKELVEREMPWLWEAKGLNVGET
ncbi:MAG: hypothetical protein M1831_000556 [Alyxoria varia]|nr:MAG: hypothetical protein M1831_000556 [Alyxoria varia]